MSLTREDLLWSLPEHSRDYLVYYPDILLFHHNVLQYEHDWKTLAQSKYLYTNGYQIQPTNWFFYAFQTVKGWFGFENYCDQKKINYTLKKFAFYGYLCGYSQTALASMNYYPIQPSYLDRVTGPKTEQTTHLLQTQLISDYVASIEPQNRHPYLLRINNNYLYGEIWHHLKQWREIPFLDPQNMLLINKTIEQLEPLDSSPAHYSFQLHSQYAKQVAMYYLKLAKNEKQSMLYGWNWLSSAQKKAQKYLDRAQYFDRQTCSEELPSFIDYYLEKKDYDQAFQLINQLTDLSLALDYLLKHFTEELRLKLVQKDSPLAIVLAEHYLKNNNKLASIELALTLDSKLEEHNPVAVFTLKVSKSHYEEAFNLFQKYKKTNPLPLEPRKTLATHFDELGEMCYEEGKKYKLSKDWGKAKRSYFDSMIAKKKAYFLTEFNEHKEDWYTHQRLYAQLLIQSDIENSEGQIETLIQAVNLLDNCHSENMEEKEYHQIALTQGLMRQVDYLIKKIEVPILYSRDYETQKRHNTQHQPTFQQIKIILNRVIDLLKETKNESLKMQLAKAHFILGDMIMFFDLEEEYLTHFRAAMDNAPENPFYLLRVSEKFELERPTLAEKGISLLKKLGYSVTDYADWDNERWEKEHKCSVIKNIHDLTQKNQQQSTFSNWFN